MKINYDLHFISGLMEYWMKKKKKQKTINCELL